MNLSTLAKMISDGDVSQIALRYLLRCSGECEYLDFKQELDLSSDYGTASISKDILAMKNMGGGYLVIGVEDGTWNPAGLNKPIGLDSKQLRDKVRKATGLDLDVDIVEHEIYTDDSIKRKFAVIIVRGTTKAKKRLTPSVPIIDFCKAQKYGITRGEIYVRKGDSTIKLTSGEEIADLIESLNKKHADQDIITAHQNPSPYAVENGLYRLLPTDYNAFIGRSSTKQKILNAIEQDPRIWIINLHGPGGVGKTALATSAAYHYYEKRNEKEAFEAILFLSAKERELHATSGISTYP
jgi:hypothetical protein